MDGFSLSLRNCIIDKNAKIGNDVIIKNADVRIAFYSISTSYQLRMFKKPIGSVLYLIGL